MKKIVNRVFVTLAIIIVLVVFMFTFARYGWKLFGFAMCDSSDSIFAEDIIVENDVVKIKGGIGDSISSYVGYVYKIDGSNLYIGVNHNLLLGFFGRFGDFDISIDTNNSKIEKIYFKDSRSQRLI